MLKKALMAMFYSAFGRFYGLAALVKQSPHCRIACGDKRSFSVMRSVRQKHRQEIAKIARIENC